MGRASVPPTAASPSVGTERGGSFAHEIGCDARLCPTAVVEDATALAAKVSLPDESYVRAFVLTDQPYFAICRRREVVGVDAASSLGGRRNWIQEYAFLRRAIGKRQTLQVELFRFAASPSPPTIRRWTCLGGHGRRRTDHTLGGLGCAQPTTRGHERCRDRPACQLHRMTENASAVSDGLIPMRLDPLDRMVRVWISPKFGGTCCSSTSIPTIPSNLMKKHA